MSESSVSKRVQKHRDALRAAGLRPIQIWVPDSRREGFGDECRRQAALVAQSDSMAPSINDWMDEVASEIDGWTA